MIEYYGLMIQWQFESDHPYSPGNPSSRMNELSGGVSQGTPTLLTLRVGASLPPSLLWLSRSGQEYQQLSVTAEEERGREGYKRQVLCSL